MAEQKRGGRSRAFREVMPVLRSFLEGVRDHAPTEVRTTLRKAVDPGQVLAVSRPTFRDAVEAWLSPSSECVALASLFEACHNVRRGQAEEADGAADREAPVLTCLSQHGGHCSGLQYLVALTQDCRREREDRPYCLGVRDGEDDDGKGGCEGYGRLDDAVRRCLGVNGPRCYAAEVLEEPVPSAGEPPDDATLTNGAASQAAESLLSTIWSWARRWNLVADLHDLRRAAAASGRDPLLPEIVYHTSFLLVVYHTLQVSASAAEQDRFDWAFPQVGEVVFNEAFLELHQGLVECSEPGEDDQPPAFVCGQDDPYRYEITFRPRKWDFLSETPAAAATRMAEEFRGCVHRMLTRHYEELKQMEELRPAREGLDPEHVKWLVEYQVIGEKNFTELAATKPNKDTYDEERHAATVIGHAVKDAAKQLLGPRYDMWLRRPRVGRPPKGDGSQQRTTPPPA